MLNINEHGKIFVKDSPIDNLAKGLKTPFYLYCEKQIEHNINKLKQSMSKHFKNFKIQYAIKANSNPHLLKIIQKNGLYADCSSPLELELAKRTGFDLSNSSYTGNYESIDDFSFVLQNDVILNLDDFQRLDDLPKIPETISFRINPGIGKGGFEQIVTGGTDAKFGIPFEKTTEAFEKAKKLGVKKFGIHMMTGSNILGPFYFAEVTQKLLSIIDEFLPKDIKLDFINIGGGLGVSYSDEEQDLDLDQTFHLVSQVYENSEVVKAHGHPTIVIEPGRYIVANAGIIVSSITNIKRSYKNFIGIDAGMNTLLRPSLYNAYHRVHIDNHLPKGDGTPYYICGQICENSDIHPHPRYFDNVNKNSFVVIENCGAYGFTMSSNYNNRPRPSEYLLNKDDELIQIRKEQDFSDMLKEVTNFE